MTVTATEDAEVLRKQGAADAATAPVEAAPDPSSVRRPRLVPEKSSDAPTLHGGMSEAEQIALVQAHLARKRAAGAFKKSSVTSAAETVEDVSKQAFDASRSTLGKGVGKAVDELAGVNVAGHAKNALLAAQIASIAVQRQDFTNKARNEMDRVENRIAGQKLHASVEDFKADTGPGYLSEMSDEDRTKAATALRSKDDPDHTEALGKFRSSKANQATLAMMKKFAKNQKLLASDKRMGNDTLEAWSQEQTAGASVPEGLKNTLVAGHVVSKDDVVAASTGGDVGRGLKSLNPMANRPLFNTAKLSDDQKAQESALNQERTALEGKRDADLEHRKTLTDTLGYTKEEFDRRGELKGTIAGLEGQRSARTWVPGLGYGLTRGEQEQHAMAGQVIDGIHESARKRMHDEHMAVYDQLHAATAKGQKEFKSTHGAEYESVKKEIASLQKSHDKQAKSGAEVSADSQMRLQQLMTRKDELKHLKEHGLSAEDRARKKSAKEQADAIKAGKAPVSLDATEEAMVAQHRSTQERLDHVKQTGLTKEQHEQLTAATAERTAQKARRDTGLSQEDHDRLGGIKSEIAGIYGAAKDERGFVDEHAGKTVSAIGTVGGLDGADTVDASKTEVTTAGRAAQIGRSIGSGVEAFGDVLNPSRGKIQESIDNGELGWATAQLAGSVTAETLSTAGNVIMPVAGTVGKKGMQGLGKLGQGTGQVIKALASSKAEEQDQRDRQADLTSGKRQQQTLEQAVNFSSLSKEPKPGALAQLAGGAKTILTSGVGALGDLQESATEAATDKAKEVLGLSSEDQAEHTAPEAQKPEAEHHEPEAEHHEPEAEHHEPEAEHHEPEAEHHEPEAEHHEPEAEHHEPEAEHHEPEAEHHEPEADKEEDKGDDIEDGDAPGAAPAVPERPTSSPTSPGPSSQVTSTATSDVEHHEEPGVPQPARPSGPAVADVIPGEKKLGWWGRFKKWVKGAVSTIMPKRNRPPGERGPRLPERKPKPQREPGSYAGKPSKPAPDPGEAPKQGWFARFFGLKKKQTTS